MRIVFISMRKYKMRLGWKYKLKNLFTIEKVWGGKIIQFRILCEYGFDIDLRKRFNVLDLLTKEEKKRFLLGIYINKSEK